MCFSAREALLSAKYGLNRPFCEISNFEFRIPNLVSVILIHRKRSPFPYLGEGLVIPN